MNIAIIVSVNDYIHENELPVCDADAALVRKIIYGAKKFDHVLELTGNASSAKQKLSDFVRAHKDSVVDEVFYYYTGHGTIFSEDFCYLFADYEEKKHASTSLSNTELDDMLRSLNPGLVIKVVDACHSGVTYVKESSADLLEKSINRAKTGFRKCYFMFSSQANEPSYQDSEYSDFTRAFGETIFHHQVDSIRYTDVLSGITDYFSQHGSQTPTFVTQADHTELFFQISTEVRNELNTLLDRGPSQSNEAKADSPDATNSSGLEAMTVAPSLASRLNAQAQSYCTEEMARETFAAIRQALDRWTIGPVLADLFRVTFEFSDSSHHQIPSKSVIGKWVSENPDVFATVECGNEEYEVEKQVAHPWFFMQYETKTVTRTRKVISDFECTAESDFYCVECKFIPELINLRHWRGFLIVLCSKSTLYIFSSLSQLRDLNWNKQVVPDSAKWSISHSLLSNHDGAVSKLNAILQGFEATIVDTLRSRVETRVESVA